MKCDMSKCLKYGSINSILTYKEFIYNKSISIFYYFYFTINELLH